LRVLEWFESTVLAKKLNQEARDRMSQVRLPRPDENDLTEVSNLKSYFEKLIEELEYNLENIDQDNLTDKFKEQLEGE